VVDNDQIQSPNVTFGPSFNYGKLDTQSYFYYDQFGEYQANNYFLIYLLHFNNV